MASVSRPEFWTDLYARGGDGWELRQPAPALVEFVERTPPAPGRIAVPGCGRGHDVRYLARHGHAAVGFDRPRRSPRRVRWRMPTVFRPSSSNATSSRSAATMNARSTASGSTRASVLSIPRAAPSTSAPWARFSSQAAGSSRASSPCVAAPPARRFQSPSARCGGSSRGDFDSSVPTGHARCGSGRARSGPSSSARPMRPVERRTGRRVLAYGRPWQERDA